MDKIIRCITSDGAIMASAIDASDIVFTAKKLHNLSRSSTAALGRLLCAASIMGNMLKQKDAFINLRVLGDGEMGAVVAVADSSGNVLSAVKSQLSGTVGVLYYSSSGTASKAVVGGSYSGAFDSYGYATGGTVSGGTSGDLGTSTGGGGFGPGPGGRW